MGNDPTTTIPGAPSGNLGLILVLTLLAAFLVPVAMHVFYRSLRPRAGATHKAVAGGLGATASLVVMLLMLQVGPVVTVVLAGLTALGFLGYAFPQVRSLVRAKASELRHRRPQAAPQQPPDHATQH